VTKQSGYATKQTGYFWTKQLGLNSQHIGELLGRLFYIISTLPKGIILGAVQSNPCLSALHPGNGDIGINRSSVPLNRP